MTCPQCDGRSRVLATRHAPSSEVPAGARAVAAWLGGCTVWRRRRCRACSNSWDTLEVLLDDLQAVQQAGTR